MKRIVLDFGTCSTEKELHAYLKEQFGFPDHYGENLDALYDCLTDLAEDMEICFEEKRGDACHEAAPVAEERKEAGEREEEKESKKPEEPATERMQQYMKKVRWVIGDAAEENSRLYV